MTSCWTPCTHSAEKKEHGKWKLTLRRSVPIVEPPIPSWWKGEEIISFHGDLTLSTTSATGPLSWKHWRLSSSLHSNLPSDMVACPTLLSWAHSNQADEAVLDSHHFMTVPACLIAPFSCSGWFVCYLLRVVCIPVITHLPKLARIFHE